MISSGPFARSKTFFIDRECLASKCTTCHSELNGDDVNDVAITEVFFKMNLMTKSGVIIHQLFGINHGDVLRLHIPTLRYFQLTLEPLKCTKEKLL